MAYPEELEVLPTDISANTKDNAEGYRHSVMHNRVNAIVNALMALVGSGESEETILERLEALEAGGGGGGGGGDGGDVKRIGEVVTTGSQSVITFSSIPATYRHLELRIYGRGTASATEANAAIRFNGDSGNNYDSLRENRFGNSNGAGVGRLDCFSVPAGNAPAGTAGSAVLHIPYYANTAFHKSLVALSNMKQANVTGNLFMQSGGGFWRNSAAINSIEIALQAGAWVDGSSVTLYGLK